MNWMDAHPWAYPPCRHQWPLSCTPVAGTEHPRCGRRMGRACPPCRQVRRTWCSPHAGIGQPRRASCSVWACPPSRHVQRTWSTPRAGRRASCSGAVVHAMRLHPPDLPNSEIYRFIVLVNTPTELLTCHSPIPTAHQQHRPASDPLSLVSQAVLCILGCLGLFSSDCSGFNLPVI